MRAHAENGERIEVSSVGAGQRHNHAGNVRLPVIGGACLRIEGNAALEHLGHELDLAARQAVGQCPGTLAASRTNSTRGTKRTLVFVFKPRQGCGRMLMYGVSPSSTTSGHSKPGDSGDARAREVVDLQRTFSLFVVPTIRIERMTSRLQGGCSTS